MPTEAELDQVLLARIVVAVLLAGVGVWLTSVASLARGGALERRRWYGQIARVELFSDDAWQEAQFAGAAWVAGAGYAAILGAIGVAIMARTSLAVSGLALGAVLVTVVALVVAVSLAARSARDVVRGRR